MALLLNAIRLALAAITRNKTRSLLTVLGILIGVAAVVTVTALATAASDLVGGSIDSFASNAIYVQPQMAQQKGVKRSSARLTDNDGRAIAREAVSITDVASFSGTSGQVIYADKNVSTYVVGTQLPYFKIRKFTVSRGAQWTESDELLKTKVCVVGVTVAKKLFEGDEPIGKTVRIGRAPYKVIGVLEEKGTSMFGDDQDDRVMMPIGSYRARVVHTSPGRADQLMASASSEDTTDRAMKQVTSILRQKHRIPDGAENDFRISSQQEFRATEQAIATVLSALLMGVAAISLLVGGVGVMNIMLVSVSERTREIGIRMSIGAREGDILLQFLVEAIVLSTVGGIAGVVVGMVSAFGLGFVLDWRVVPRLDALAVALVTSAVIGVAFGFLPARRAARMDPIDALRTE
ncbi:MAG: Macrolide export ATP-binding/permease protein MacB [Myxococcaceae bacterium]|nr:Macrolide export ATP-binding/permease protein MacB [Myxococcaceae bacterium]